MVCCISFLASKPYKLMTVSLFLDEEGLSLLAIQSKNKTKQNHSDFISHYNLKPSHKIHHNNQKINYTNLNHNKILQILLTRLAKFLGLHHIQQSCALKYSPSHSSTELLFYKSQVEDLKPRLLP